jgi:hypothetical protein
MDRDWVQARDRLLTDWTGVVAQQRDQLRRQITAAVDAGDPDRLAALEIDTESGAALLETAMRRFAQSAGEAMEREARAQGVDVPKWSIPDDEGDAVTAAAGLELIRAAARTTARILGLSLVNSAARRALQLIGLGRSGKQVADQVDTHLRSLTDAQPKESIGAALTTAQNEGRLAVLRVAPTGEYTASEILDRNTCAPCRSVDGKTFGSLSEAESAYPSGNYAKCLGGTRCRGTFVAVWDAAETVTAAATEETMEDETYLTAAAASEDGSTAPWEGVLAVEGITTGDGREFAPDALTWADLPIPLRWNKEDSHGGEPHTVAVNVGRIDAIWRDGNKIMGSGVLNLGEPDGKRAYDLIRGSFLRGVSIDADSIGDADMEFVWPEGMESAAEEDPLAALFASPEKVVFHGGRIRAATLVDIPAFAEAYVGLTNPASVDPAVVTASIALWTPPASWFADPSLSGPTPITITADGRLFGHAARWGECHIGQQGVCVSPPQEDSHPYFMTGELTTDSGDVVSVGQITVGTGHAPLHMGASPAAAHYDNTGWAVADVVVGNDHFGIWVAGAVRPGTDPMKIHELRAAGQVSGDWRRIGGQLRLVGLLAVNVPGFPVPKMAARLTSGRQVALVAAGIPQVDPVISPQMLDQMARDRVMQMLSARVHKGGE